MGKDKKIKNNKEDNKKSKNESEQLKNQLARALADYDNLQKRLEKDQIGFRSQVVVRIANKLLPIFDMLLTIQEHIEDSGLSIAIHEFEKALNEENVYRINVKKGDMFDENLHDAVDTVKAESEGKVAEVLLDGWRIKEGQVIRPVKVKVTKK